MKKRIIALAVLAIMMVSLFSIALAASYCNHMHRQPYAKSYSSIAIDSNSSGHLSSYVQRAKCLDCNDDVAYDSGFEWLSHTYSRTYDSAKKQDCLKCTKQGCGYKTYVAHQHSYGRATCTQPSKCVCGAINPKAPTGLGHHYNPASGRCDRCNIKMK